MAAIGAVVACPRPRDGGASFGGGKNMTARHKYSPTIIERYLDSAWWLRNGGGYGLLPDGGAMNDRYHAYDHDGYDAFGYDLNGKDRAGHTVRDYLVDPDLYGEVVDAVQGKACSVPNAAHYWPLVRAISDHASERFPDLPVSDPQDRAPSRPGIHRLRHASGAYSVLVRFEDEAGSPRSVEVRVESAGEANGAARWFGRVLTRQAGETSVTRIDPVGSFGFTLAAQAAIDAFDPFRDLHDIHIVEARDGSAYLRATPRSQPEPEGDRVGTVYARDPEQALARFAASASEGGPLFRMAARGAAALRRESGSPPAKIVAFRDRVAEALDAPAAPRPA